MVRTKQLARKAGGKQKALSMRKAASTFAGICKLGSCIRHDGHSGPCKDANMDDEEYEVEEIVDERVRSTGMEYHVKWVGWPDEDCTWESVGALTNCREKLLAWMFREYD